MSFSCQFCEKLRSLEVVKFLFLTDKQITFAINIRIGYSSGWTFESISPLNEEFSCFPINTFLLRCLKVIIIVSCRSLTLSTMFFNERSY